jgi:hypothetical protein
LGWLTAKLEALAIAIAIASAVPSCIEVLISPDASPVWCRRVVLSIPQ